MTDSTLALARRAVACPRWRWLPGMRLECGDILIVSDDQHWHCGGAGILPQWIRWRHDRMGDPMRGSLPDLSDPATLGCLLALVREAYSDPRAWVVCYGDEHRPWTVWARLDGDADDGVAHGRTEAEALVNALENAP